MVFFYTMKIVKRENVYTNFKVINYRNDVFEFIIISHRSIPFGLKTYMVLSVTMSCFNKSFPVIVQLFMPISGYDTATFHRRDYAVSIATLIMCAIVINWLDAVYLSHCTSILIVLSGNIMNHLSVVILL